MTIASSKSTETTRTDDLLASGTEQKDGASGFEGKANPDALQTGMEGIAGATVQQQAGKTGSNDAGTTETVQDNAGQVRNKQGV